MGKSEYRNVPNGEDAATAKLVADDIPAIIELVESNGMTQRAVAAEYGVSVASIYNILRGKTWKSVTGR